MLLMRQHYDGPEDNISITACSPVDKQVFLYLMVPSRYTTTAYQASFIGQVPGQVMVRILA